MIFLNFIDPNFPTNLAHDFLKNKKLITLKT